MDEFWKNCTKLLNLNKTLGLKQYIDKNTGLRKKAKKDDFEKDVFKFMNNAVFRKTMENMGKH